MYRYLFCMNKPYFCQIFFLTDWHHKRLKNTIDLLLFYGFFYLHFGKCIVFKKIEEKKRRNRRWNQRFRYEFFKEGPGDRDTKKICLRVLSTWLVIYPMLENNATLRIGFTDLRKWNLVCSFFEIVFRKWYTCYE